MAMMGYYGEPGKYGGKVHIVYQNKPLCGWNPRKELEFQWCRHGIALNDVECGNCERIARKRLAEGEQNDENTGCCICAFDWCC